MVQPLMFTPGDVQKLRSIILKELRVPGVCIIHPAVLGVMVHGLTSAIVICGGFSCTKIVPVWNHYPLVDKIMSFPISGLDVPSLEGPQATAAFFTSNANIAHATYDVIESISDEQQKKAFSTNIVLTGGVSCVFGDTFALEIKKMLPAVSVKASRAEERELDMCRGGEVFCRLSNALDYFTDLP